MYKYVIGRSCNGCEVYTSIIKSVAGKYLSQQPYLFHIVKDVVAALNLTQAKVTIERDTGRTIGNTNIVATEEKDTIYYAKPPRRSNNLRFVKNRSLLPSSELVMTLQRDEAGNYEVVDFWIGPQHPPFPDADDATPESSEYWQHHALVAGTEVIDLQSVTRNWPY